MATLYVVSTPIGNLEDLSPRAVRTLTTVSRILAEDTRRTRILTERIGARAPLVSLHEHNEASRVDTVLGWLAAGEDVALVSDAGTPLVSDPGARLVEAVAAAGHAVVPIPGPSAVLAALAVSGLPTERFTFLGFPERKGKARREILRRVATSSETTLLFESPRRVAALLEDLSRACGGERRAVVCREMTKVHEEVRRGSLEGLAAWFRDHEPRGEVTVVVAPSPGEDGEAALEAGAEALARELLDQGLRPSQVARDLSARLDVPRNMAYRIVQELC
ncbi:MAG: 16S rRNA (cytidine(1402)-2'-O)-methyltransferase [Gemmatimonadota bacterium]